MSPLPTATCWEYCCWAWPRCCWQATTAARRKKKSSFLVWGLPAGGPCHKTDLLCCPKSYFLFGCRRNPVSLYSFWTFAIASAVLWCILPLIPRERTKPDCFPEKSTLPALADSGSSGILISQLVTSASAVLPSVVIFPAFNGLGLVLATLLSAICFQERLTLRSVLGMLLGIGGTFIDAITKITPTGPVQ